MMDDYFGIIKNETDEGVKEWLRKDPKNLLLAELFVAERQARKGGKGKTYDTHAFEVNLFENLARLGDAIWNYEYKPSSGTAHIIYDPVQREIFAAPYVDRIAHHFVVNNLVEWWDNRLNYDSYSCRKGKGTAFGIKRLDYHIRAVSKNFARPCYVVKMDISGYFMHINKKLLYERVLWGLDRQFEDHKSKRYLMLKHLIYEIVFDNPVDGVNIQGSYEDWRGLPEDKSLFCQPFGMGMVIGNLTSQFFSNIYLDVLDRFVTMELGYKHYGRYVDDFFIVVTEDELLQVKKDIRAIATFLEGIGLFLNKKKTKIFPSWQGVPFLGMVVREDAILPGKRVTKNFLKKAREITNGNGKLESVPSYLGMLCHYDAKKVTSKIFDAVGWDYNW